MDDELYGMSRERSCAKINQNYFFFPFFSSIVVDLVGSNDQSVLPTAPSVVCTLSKQISEFGRVDM